MTKPTTTRAAKAPSLGFAQRLSRWLFLPLLLAGCVHKKDGPLANPAASTVRVMKSEFIYESAPFPSCHASTLAEAQPGKIVAAWFGGTEEKAKDVGIWVAHSSVGAWSTPVEVANGVQSDGTRHPCWNPVLFQVPNGPLVLFYKVGPSPDTWWGMRMQSGDGGLSWSKPERLPDGILGPIKNKPVLVGSSLWCPSSSEDHGWRIHLEYTGDWGKTWTRTMALNDGKEFSAIQPTILAWRPDFIQLLCRSRQGSMTECWSSDGGKTFTPLRAATLPNPNSGFDGVVLKDGRAVLIYNHTRRGRTPLNLATSSDGKTWMPLATLETEPGEYSYPAIIQTADGLIHATYTWKRQRIKHVVVKP